MPKVTDDAVTIAAIAKHRNLIMFIIAMVFLSHLDQKIIILYAL